MTIRMPRIAWIGMAVVLAAAALAFARWYLGPKVSAYEASREDIVQTVVASGRVESPRRVEIGSAVVGTVVSVPVAEGQSVGAGQLLVALDDAEARAAVQAGRSGVAQAEARMAQLPQTTRPVADEAVRQAQANLTNAERQLARNRELLARGFVGQAVLDDAQRNRDVAASQLASAKLQRASLAPGGADYQVALTALEQARSTLAAAQAHLELMTIEAPAAGALISRDVEVGNVAQPGKVLMVLSPAGQTQLTVQIDEKNLNYLKAGQQALASADAYPRERFAAELVYINPGVDPLRGSVEVKLRVAQPPAYLLQDMTVSVDIEVARRAQALTIPADAVHDPGSASPWILVARDGRAEKRAVKLGVRGNAGRVEVVEGLAQGERVIPSTEAAAQEGKRLRPS